jgi:phosphoglycolate phosphatase-like HAD superfamily hydrolase
VKRFRGALLWDLDGTLLTTAKAGRFALRDAVHELCGVEPDYTDLQTAGFTDAEVIASALRWVGIDPSEGLIGRVRAEYEQRLPAALLLREGGVLPGVREALDSLAARRRVVSLLLTGNTPAGATAKLERYGIADCFPYGGAFCEGERARVPIARRALARAQELTGGDDLDKVVLIGDTPRDMACAVEIGVRAIGVATGAHSLDELRAADAWRAVERIPDVERLEALVLEDG